MHSTIWYSTFDVFSTFDDITGAKINYMPSKTCHTWPDNDKKTCGPTTKCQPITGNSILAQNHDNSVYNVKHRGGLNSYLSWKHLIFVGI